MILRIIYMKPIFYILIISLLASCKSGQVKDTSIVDNIERNNLKKYFISWKENEIAKGNLVPEDSCFPARYVEHDIEALIENMWAVPDSSQINYSYADINSDGKLDQLVCFIPSQCDGGNASMWTQLEVLTVSENGKYKTSTNLGDGMFSVVGKDSTGFYWYDSIGVNKIYATYYSFSEGDPHCCPSTMKSVIFDYKTMKVIYMGDNIKSE